ncbi:MAG: hypothetical protein H0U74_19770 [Bradymonadaceae bacterium]|nr:hypothetical protein [Lujinxingiaceae bacterium]
MNHRSILIAAALSASALLVCAPTAHAAAPLFGPEASSSAAGCMDEPADAGNTVAVAMTVGFLTLWRRRVRQR